MSRFRSKSPERSVPPALWAILALALLVRMVYLLAGRESPFYEPLLLDPAYYHRWALRILGGDWLGEPVFYGLPLYPFFLAFLYKIFGVSFTAVKAVQVLLGVSTVFLVFKIGEKILDRRTGLWAAFAAAVYGPLFFHETLFIAEAIGVPLYALGFYLACVFDENPTVKKGLWLGWVLGLAMLTKASVFLFFIFFIAFMLLRRPRPPLELRRTFGLAALAAAFFLTLSPVAAHNFIYGKDKVLLTSHAGFNFYIGNNPAAEGVFLAPEGTGSNVDAQIQDSRALAEKALGRSLKPSEVSKYWSDRAWEFIAGNPVRFLGLSLRKLVLFFDAREISDVDDYVFSKRFNPVLNFPWLNFAVLGPLFFLGLAASYKNLKHRELVYGWIGCYLLGLMGFFINARYRLPVLSVILPIAAAGFIFLWERWKRGDWLRVFYSALILAAAAWLTQAQLVGTNRVRDVLNTGDIYFEKKDYGRALEYTTEALEMDPESSKANLQMGVLLTKLGRYDESKEYYLKSIALEPGSMAFNNLGLWYDRAGNLSEAEECFLKALKHRPHSSQAHNNLGMVYGKTNRVREAIKEFRTSLELNPSSPRAHTNLGLMLYREGEADEARRCWERALSLDPGFEEARRALSYLKEARR